MYSLPVFGAFLWPMLQREKVSPKGLTFVSFAVAGLALTTSLAVRSVALWVKGTLVGFVL